jgi:hypothetical protein
MQLSATHLSAGAGRGRPPFHPRQLFTGADLGFVQDPRVAGALFEESTGITPITSADRPNGLLLDDRFRLALGADISVNGSFLSGTTGWEPFNAQSAISVVSGEITSAQTGTLTAALGPAQVLNLTVGKAYRVDGFLRRAGGAETVEISVTNNARDAFVARGAPITSTTTVQTSLAFFATQTNNVLYLRSGRTSPATGWTGGFFDNISIKEIPGSHASQASPPSRPIFQTGPSRVVFDGVDDSHITTFPTSLGSNCTVARAIPGTGAQILTGQTIGTSFTNTVTHAGLVVINRALTSSETANLTSWLNRAAGL